MHYSFATEDLDYSDFASGRVLYNQPGQPALPVPLLPTIERFREEFDASESKVAQLQEQQAKTKRELESLRYGYRELLGVSGGAASIFLASATEKRRCG